MATLQFGSWSNNLVVIFFDLPDSAYDDLFFTPASGSTGARIAVDASTGASENGPNGGVPNNIRSPATCHIETGPRNNQHELGGRAILSIVSKTIRVFFETLVGRLSL